jgi:hypothetical protein
MSDYIDIPTAARALGKSTDAIRKVIERHGVPTKEAAGRVRIRVRLSDLQHAYATKVADRGW